MRADRQTKNRAYQSLVLSSAINLSCGVALLLLIWNARESSLLLNSKNSLFATAQHCGSFNDTCPDINTFSTEKVTTCEFLQIQHCLDESRTLLLAGLLLTISVAATICFMAAEVISKSQEANAHDRNAEERLLEQEGRPPNPA
jgi:hypothetical protein